MDKLDQFMFYLKDMDKSKLTIKNYTSDIKLFLKYLKHEHIEFKKIDKNTIKEYISYLYHNDYKPTSINRKLISINQYLLFNNMKIIIRNEKIHSQNFLNNIPEVKDILNIIHEAEKHKDFRAKALIYTLFYTGMRISESLQLTTNDVGKNKVEIRGKGNKLRNVFIPEKLNSIWNEYLPHRIKRSSFLFTGQKGGINRHTAYKILRKYGSLANVDIKKLKLHNIRHLYGKRLNDKNLSIDVIADLLGHVNIQTSRIYLRHSQEELLDIINDI